MMMMMLMMVVVMIILGKRILKKGKVYHLLTLIIVNVVIKTMEQSS